MLFLRFAECEQSRDVEAVTGKITYKCKCGGKWSNGITGFKGHEDCGKHKQHFPPDSWEGLYSAAANRADQPVLAENAGAGAEDRLAVICGAEAEEAGVVVEEMTDVNAGGCAGYMDAHSGNSRVAGIFGKVRPIGGKRIVCCRRDSFAMCASCTVRSASNIHSTRVVFC